MQSFDHSPLTHGESNTTLAGSYPCDVRLPKDWEERNNGEFKRVILIKMIIRSIVCRMSYDKYGVSMIFVAVTGICIAAFPTVLFSEHAGYTEEDARV